MGVSPDIGIDAEADIGCFPFLGCQFVDHLQLGFALYVEAEDVGIERGVDFPIRLAYTGIDDLRGRKASRQCSLYLTSTHTVGAQSLLCNETQDLGIGVCLDRIMNHKTGMSGSLLLHALQCCLQHRGVVVVERCLNLVEQVCGKRSLHISLSVYIRYTMWGILI